MNSTDWNHCVTGFTTFMTRLATLVFISMGAEKKKSNRERKEPSVFKVIYRHGNGLPNTTFKEKWSNAGRV